MRTFLSFLKEFEVQTKLSLCTFLSKANLTEVEKAYLADHLEEIELLYKVTYEEKGELLVFRAKLKKWDDEYVESKVAGMIAQSMPYAVLVGVQNGKAVKFVITKRRDNKRKSNRSLVDKSRTFPSIVLERESSTDWQIQQALSNCILIANSPEDAVSRLTYECARLWNVRRETHLDKLIDAGIVEINEFDEGPAFFVNHPVETEVAIKTKDPGYLKEVFRNDWKITGE